MALCLLLTLFSAPELLAGDSLKFQHTDLDKILAKSANNRKPVLAYFHFKGCGSCIKMEKEVFTQAKVSNFFSEHFNLIDINTLEEPGKSIKEKYGVLGQPFFIALDAKGNPIHQFGYSDGDQFLWHGDLIVNQRQKLKRVYGKVDEMTIEELRFRNMLNMYAHKLDSALVMEFFNRLDPADYHKRENREAIYHFSTHFKDQLFTLPHKHPALVYMYENMASFDSLFKPEQVRSHLYFPFHQVANSTTDEAEFRSALEVIKELLPAKDEYISYETHMGNRVLMINNTYPIETLEMDFLKRIGDSTRYQKKLEAFEKLIWDDLEYLEMQAFLGGEFDLESKEEHLRCLRYAKRAQELNPKGGNYLHMAKIYQKLDQIPLAKEYALKAQEIHPENEDCQKLLQALSNQGK
ncbi:MAG: thioredoxin family protein [Luteibaculum sp.]